MQKQLLWATKIHIQQNLSQAATGHIIDPKNNKKLTVDEACINETVDSADRDSLLEAEAAAVGYKDPYSAKPLSVFEAMKKGLVDDETGLRLLQAQESVGGILDPNLSVFLPKDTAIERKILDENTKCTLNQSPKYYIDPETEESVSYIDLKKRCKIEPQTGQLLLPVAKKLDPNKLIFDGVRKPVTAKQLIEYEVLDKETLKDLQTEKKSVPEVSADKRVNLKGTGPIAGIVTGKNTKISLQEAKKQMLLPVELCADLLLEAQAATGHIIDPKNNKKLTVDEACTDKTVDSGDHGRLLAAEKAAVGYKDPYSVKPLSVFEAMKKGLVDNETGLRLLQAQESVGGIMDPSLSVFLPLDLAVKRNILDTNTSHSLKKHPKCYIDPETDVNISYADLKKRCRTEPHTGLLLLPVKDKLDASKLVFNVSKSIDPSNLIFDGVRKSISILFLSTTGQGSQHGGAKGSVVPGPRLLGAQNWTHSINLY
uniref:Desmoplakin n=1 Tax=Periophthalmus magnuspinnatus TaxID=409849 RepID=A0A3B3ZBF2_9GOBI